jgi:hypothetical protein
VSLRIAVVSLYAALIILLRSSSIQSNAEVGASLDSNKNRAAFAL